MHEKVLLLIKNLHEPQKSLLLTVRSLLAAEKDLPHGRWCFASRQKTVPAGKMNVSEGRKYLLSPLKNLHFSPMNLLFAPKNLLSK